MQHTEPLREPGSQRVRLDVDASGRGDRIFENATRVGAVAVLVLLGVIILMLIYESRSILGHQGLGQFLFTTRWDPVFREFGTLAFIYGTVVTSLIALFLATPIAVGAAIYIVEYAPTWLRNPVSFTVELLAAIPSIIFGLWGFFILAPIMRFHVEPFLQTYLGPIPLVGGLFDGTPIGKDLLTGGVILAIMILPTIMAISREVIGQVPDTQREGMHSLGATKWEVIRGAVLPYARAGIAGAAILGLARAFGETMAVTMVIGNSSREITGSLFTPGYTMASAIATQFREADSNVYFSAIVAIALVLLVIATIINICARLLIRGLIGGVSSNTRL
jgi:phosphate transport system permease protein